MPLKRYCFILIAAYLLSPPGVKGINLGPLYNSEINSEYERQYNALGPFISYKKSEDYSEFGLRPLYHKTTKTRGDVKELEFIYPLSSYKRKENFSWFQYQLFLIVYNTRETGSGYVNKEFNIFPFIFYNREENPENNHFAVFPIYGNMKNKFFKERLTFFLFPFYLDTENEGEKTTSLLWPIVSSYSGDTEGFRVWPLYGTRSNVARKTYDKFILWPFYVDRERYFHGERFYITSFFPVYSDSYFHGVSNKGYLWPFFQHTINHNTNSERWDTPWPIINFTKGDTQQLRVLPFYSKTVRPDGDRDGFIMWPVYRYKTVKLESHRRYKKSVLFILYKDTEYEPIVEGFKPERKIDLWPLFTYEKDADGKKKFHIFTVFEPFIHSNDRLYRNYASFWRLFVWEKNEDDVSRSSLLWNLVSSYRDVNMFVFDIRPIIPLFNYTRSDADKSWNILGGLIGYAKKEGQDILKIFYVPLKV